MAWKFDNFGNARNDKTGEELYAIICPDGLSRVYHDEKILAVFHHNAEALNFIKRKVEEWERLKVD